MTSLEAGIYPLRSAKLTGEALLELGSNDLPCTCTALRRMTRSLTAAYDVALAPAGLRITQFSVLRTLARLGPMPVTRLAAVAALDRSTMGRNLDAMERNGWLRIDIGASDQRERVASLTDAGIAAIETALPYWRDIQQRLAAVLPPSIIDTLGERVDRLSEEISK